MKSKVRSIVLLAIAACVGLSVFAGCSSPSNEEVDEAALNREYMAQVNSFMDDLNAGLADFSGAVSDNDLVGMKTHSEKAFKAIDELEKLEAPEALSEVHDGYLSGCKDLKKALNGYIDLYIAIDTATEEEPYDYSNHDAELAKIQNDYNSGIEHLRTADTLASEIE